MASTTVEVIYFQYVTRMLHHEIERLKYATSLLSFGKCAMLAHLSRDRVTRSMSRRRPPTSDRVKVQKQLVVNMTKLMTAYGCDNDSAFARFANINRTLITKLRTDQWWEIPRDSLQILAGLAAQKDFPFIETRDHPIWATFDDSATVVFIPKGVRGSHVREDVEVYSKFSGVGLNVVHADGNADVKESMKSNNTIIVGGPRYGYATDAALAALWNEQPGRPIEKALPLEFRWRPTPGFEDAGPRTFGRLGPRRELIFVSDGQQKVYGDSEGSKRIGAVVVCRRPLGTRKAVTTIIVAGCSSEATTQMATDLINGVLHLTPAHLEDGKPCRAIFRMGIKGQRWTILDSAKM
jgi:hypothetical protein